MLCQGFRRSLKNLGGICKQVHQFSWDEENLQYLQDSLKNWIVHPRVVRLLKLLSTGQEVALYLPGLADSCHVLQDPRMVVISSGQTTRIIGKSIRKSHRHVSTITECCLDVFIFPPRDEQISPPTVILVLFNVHTPLSQMVYFLPTFTSVFRND